MTARKAGTRGMTGIGTLLAVSTARLIQHLDQFMLTVGAPVKTGLDKTGLVAAREKGVAYAARGWNLVGGESIGAHTFQKVGRKSGIRSPRGRLPS
jgi:hypothetical protein